VDHEPRRPISLTSRRDVGGVLTQADQAYGDAQTALKTGDLAGYQTAC
jgi:hypothetical protein